MIRRYEGGTLVGPHSQRGLSVFLLVAAGNAIAFAAFAVLCIAVGNYAEATVGVILAVLCVRAIHVIKSRSRQASVQQIWISDSSESHGSVPTLGHAVKIDAQQIARIRLYYRDNPTEARSGYLEAVVELHDGAHDYALLRAWPFRLASTMATLDGLAHRWHTTVDFDHRSIAPTKRSLGAGGAYAMMVLAICPFIYGAWIAYRQWSVLSWPRTRATVIEYDPGVGGDLGMHWYANPAIKYRYVVAGVAYDGEKLNPSPWNYQRQSYFDIDTAAFRIGATIPCWYDRSRPSIAYVVNSGVTTDAVVLVVAGAVGIALIVVFVRMSRATARLLESRFEKE